MVDRSDLAFTLQPDPCWSLIHEQAAARMLQHATSDTARASEFGDGGDGPFECRHEDGSLGGLEYFAGVLGGFLGCRHDKAE